MANDDVIVIVEDSTYLAGHQIAAGEAVRFTPPAGGCSVLFDRTPIKTEPKSIPQKGEYYELEDEKTTYAFHFNFPAGNTQVNYWLDAPSGSNPRATTGPGHPVLVGATGPF